jgi:hypothetical protein
VNAFFLMVAYAGSGAGLVQALMPALILWYLNTDEVKAAFGMGEASSGPPPSSPPPSSPPPSSPSPTA